LAVLAGCTRFSLRPQVALSNVVPEPRAGVRLRTFANDATRKAGESYIHEIHTELWLLRSEGVRELVHRARVPEWSRDDLVPGRYELVVVQVSNGVSAAAPAGRRSRRFQVEEGQAAEIALTVQSVPWEGLLVVFIVFSVVVVLVAVLVVANGGLGGGGGGNGAPGGGSPGMTGTGMAKFGPVTATPGDVAAALLWPTRILILPADVYIGTPWPYDYDRDYPPPPPQPAAPGILSILPHGPDGGVSIRFTEPMRTTDLGPDTLILADQAGPTAEGISVDPDGMCAHVRPLRPLAPGHWTVRVRGKAIGTVRGVSLGYDAQVGFDV
jgi:hypothetical protein